MAGRFCDAVLQVNGHTFAAHRNILASGSPYFDAILKKNVVIKEQVCLRDREIKPYFLKYYW